MINEAGLGAAVIGGDDLRILVDLARLGLATQERLRGRPSPRASAVHGQLAGIAERGAMLNRELAAAISASGNAEYREDSAEARSITEWVSTEEAADRLGLTVRRVRQLCAQEALRGRHQRRNSPWQVDAQSIALYVAGRAA